jgi:hypothetical protein
MVIENKYARRTNHRDSADQRTLHLLVLKMIELNTRVIIENSPLIPWNGQTGTVVATDHPMYTVRLDNIRETAARFEHSELRPI